MHFLVALVLLSPLTVLVHELGHAAAFLGSGAQRVRVDLGRGSGRAVGIGRFELALHWRIALGEGSARGDADLTRREMIVVAAAGPVASLGGFAAGLLLGYFGGWSGALEAWTAANFIGFLNLLPFTVGPARSDGRVILEALGALGDPKPDQAPMRRAYLVALAAAVPLAFVVDIIFGFFMVLTAVVCWADFKPEEAPSDADQAAASPS